MKYIKANRINFQIEPSFDNEETKSFIRLVKQKIDILTNYESRQKENEHFFSNGPSIKSEKEIILKLTDDNDLLLAWGDEVGFEVITKILRLIFKGDFSFLDKYRINSFDSGFIFGIDYKNNAYEIIRKSFYNDDINNFYNKLPNTKPLDNDIHLLIAHEKNMTISCSVSGLTNRIEIETDDYEEKEIRFRFGILFGKVSNTEDELFDVIINHYNYTKGICEQYYYPTFVENSLQNID